MQTNIEITRAFMDTPDGVLSIHQISRKLKLPYGTAYNRVHLLHESGIVQILPQGKAKLCALNPDNPMTASLLALGAAQTTDHFIKRNFAAGDLLKKIRRVVLDNARDSLYAAIILAPDLLTVAADSSENNKTTLGSSMADVSLPGMGSDFPSTATLDFFYIKASDDFDEQRVENSITALLAPGSNIRATSMTVDRDTLLGMFTENENEAGLAAYAMLREGMLLFGFENFYTLILEAFARKLSA
ncbi:MAG TPA: helix-turn-helix domain-containing protein [Candidatus Rifleibacterium sp.]|nr:helix-turn-helix domain-containing protein [Candidatus Rifleibacterium sp.]HPT47288.1 helix-turn-helix domain-containing protein [Candidatus Rifleibacterium sp.]